MNRADQNQTERNIRTEKQVPVERKMKLIQCIRAENMDNRMKIRQREQLLYGADNFPPLWNKGESLSAEEYIRTGEGAEDTIPTSSGTFKLRMAAAIILFIGFLLCDAGQYKIFGYTMNDIYGMISEDYFQIYDTENGDELPQLTELLKFDL